MIFLLLHNCNNNKVSVFEKKERFSYITIFQTSRDNPRIFEKIQFTRCALKKLKTQRTEWKTCGDIIFLGFKTNEQ